MMVSMLVKQIYVTNIVNLLSKHHTEGVRKRCVKLRAMWLVFKISMKFKMHLKRRRSAPTHLHQNKILNNFSFKVICRFSILEQRCKRTMANFVWDNIGVVIFTKMLRNTHRILQNIQNKFLKQKDFKNSKIDVLLHYWEKLWKQV